MRVEGCEERGRYGGCNKIKWRGQKFLAALFITHWREALP